MGTILPPSVFKKNADFIGWKNLLKTEDCHTILNWIPKSVENESPRFFRIDMKFTRNPNPAVHLSTHHIQPLS